MRRQRVVVVNNAIDESQSLATSAKELPLLMPLRDGVLAMRMAVATMTSATTVNLMTIVNRNNQRDRSGRQSTRVNCLLLL
jgi:hypothetical protein